MAAEAEGGNGAEAAAAPDASAEQVSGEVAHGSTREMSTIAFPYSNLEDAESGAKALFAQAGTTAVTMAQAAAAMGQSAASSTFRVRLATMRIFGLLESESGHVWLTDSGRGISEAHTALEARAKAFARIPLYAKVIAEHDGRTLPPPAALEREFASWGVARKQTERARQVFERSAKWAGYIKAGSDRFVSPIVRGASTPENGGPAEKPRIEEHRAAGGSADQDPVIQALVRKIPPSGSPWGIDEQVMWLRMMAMAFSMTFGGKRGIKIEPEPEPPRGA